MIDFGLAYIDDPPQGLRLPHRGGIGYYYEPEYARAQINNEPPPAPSQMAEQYSLGVLLYYMFTGTHYLNFKLERAISLQQIIEEPMMSFAHRGIEPWPEIEHVLMRALSKDPEDRFPSLSKFISELQMCEDSARIRSQHASKSALVQSPTNLHTWASGKGAELLETVLKRYAVDGKWFAHGLPLPPTCSVNYGAAGIAYFYYRIACMRDDPALLSLSDLWSTQALEEHNIERAFRSIHLGITEATVGNISLYHTASGVHCVRALIAQAMGDTATLRQALSDFAAVSRLPCDNLDLTLGKSSILIGCTILLEAIGSNISSTNTDILKYLGSKILDDIWTRIKNYEHVGNSPELPYLGLAHGWAGILYAILSWCLVSGQALPHTIKQRLDELANLAKSCDKEICWPLQIGRAESWPGWCHGSAGYVHLWVLADQVLNDSRYLDLAKGAAWHTLTHAEKSSGQLCCGLSGQSYALLTLYRHTHDEKWLEPALMLGSKAVARATSSGLHIHSLYKGDVGIALLAADLANPGKSCVPMFEVHL